MSAAVRRSFDSLSVPNYRRYFAGQLVSLSGTWMQTVAAVWLVLELTDSGIAVGLATVERHGPLTPSELAEIERIKRPTATPESVRVRTSQIAATVCIQVPERETI